MSYLQQQIASLLRSAAVVEPIEPYYEVLSYITFAGGTSSGVNFDTGIIPNPNLKIDCTFRHSGVSSNNCVFGGRIATSGSDRKAFAFWNYVSGYMRADFGNTSSGSSDIGETETYDDTWVNIVYDKNKFYLNGTLKWTSSVSSFTASDEACTITIGAMNSGTSSSSSRANYFKGDIQQLKIWDDDVLVRDYIPVLDSQMRPCLYDRVNKTFTYSTITPTFKRWNKYDVDYIASDGSQYIASGLKGTTESAFFADIMITTQDNAKSRVMGNYATTNSSFTLNCCKTSGGTVGNNTCCFNGQALFATQGTNTMQLNEGERHVVGTDKEGLWLDGTKAYSWTGTPSAYTTTGEVAVLASTNSSGSVPSNLTNGVVGNCYGAWWVENGVKIRDWKPSVRTYNNGSAVVTKAFLYDEVYNKAYDNAGTGSFKAYIAPDREVYNLAMHDTMDIDGFYLAEDGTKTVSSDGTSCYTEAIQVKEGDIIQWTVTAEAVTANKRIHGYSTNADITTGQKGSWVEMLAKIVFSTTSDTTQTASFVVPSGVNYIRLSHANVREFKDSVVRIRTYEVGKAIKYPQNNGFTLDAPNSSNFILDLLTRATTTNSYYILDTRQQTGGNNDDEFGIGGSSSGATVNWKCESESNLVKTNGTNWVRGSNYTYSQLLVGYKDGNTFKRTASFYDFNNQRISDIEIVTATRDIANNTKPLTVLHTTSSNWLQNGADIHYFKYLQDDKDVWYDCIPVRNATVTSSVLLFDRVNNTSLPNTGSGTPTFVELD